MDSFILMSNKWFGVSYDKGLFFRGHVKHPFQIISILYTYKHNMKLKFVDILVCDSIKPLHLQTLRFKSKKKKVYTGD